MEPISDKDRVTAAKTVLLGAKEGAIVSNAYEASVKDPEEIELSKEVYFEIED
ncbi:MAG: hypothetical protein WCP25_09790 [Polynucleobacter sp.]